MRTPLSRPLLVLAIALALAGCVPDDAPAALQSYATLSPSPLFGVGAPTQSPATMIPTVIEPTITPPALTLPPALALPDSSGVSLGCAANTLRVPLTLPGGASVGAATRLLAGGDWLYVLADGGLYRLSREDVERGSGALAALILPGEARAGRPVQELVDFDLDPASGQIFLLDKAEHVFRFDPASGALGLAYRASPDRDEIDGAAAFQFMAITVSADGRPVLLDSSRGMLWLVEDQVTLTALNESDGLTASVDFAEANGSFFTLQANGTLRASDGDKGTLLWRDADSRRLGLSLRASNHLGIPLILAVDGLRREVITYIPGGGIVTRHAFDFPDLGLLRDAVFAAQHLYALAGAEMLVYPRPSTDGSQATCPPANADSLPPPRLFGADFPGALRGARLPLDNASLPDNFHLYPGASRLYRMGIHHGVDFYGFDRGTPVYAVAPGVVTQADVNYQDLSYDEFMRLTRQADILGMTPPESLYRLEGRRIEITHAGGIKTVYAHLDAVAPQGVPGTHVEAGALIGAVGVSGTSAESRPGTEMPHLHFEVWIGDRYLGQGLTIRETMWWLKQIFGGS